MVDNPFSEKLLHTSFYIEMLRAVAKLFQNKLSLCVKSEPVTDGADAYILNTECSYVMHRF